MWFVGVGICGGICYGVIDEFGFVVVEDWVYLYDIYVMILYLLGFDYECLIYFY